MTETFLESLANVAEPQVLLVIFASALYGIFVGSIPGLTATMAVALIVPITFFLDPIPAIAAIVTLEACSIFAGDIPTTLVRIPGTPSSAAYVDDAYALTQSGRHEQSLGISLVFSVGGGLFGAFALILAAPQLAKIAFKFTTYEYFWLYVLGLSCAAIVSHGSRIKGALALIFGLLFSTVGLSEVHSIPRFTFGNDELITGINFIPAMIGLFGLSEVFRNVLRNERRETSSPSPGLQDISVSKLFKQAFASLTHLSPVFGGLLSRFVRRPIAAVRSCCVGTVVGMIPGAGADIGAWISYAVSKRFSQNPQEYGKGSLEGIADATTANNAALAGAWIPTLVLGIPGDSVTAIVIGVLLMKNVTPGPEIFSDPDQAVLVNAIYITFILANLLLLPLGFLAIRTGSLLIHIPRRVLMPLILIFCIVGAYAINGSYFDVWVMLGMGLLGFVLERFDIPLGPVVLGIILGGKLEQSFVQNLTKSSSALPFFGMEQTPGGLELAHPIATGLGITCLLLWLVPLFSTMWRRRKMTK